MNTQLGLGLVAVLMAYLFASMGRRWHIEAAKRRAWKREWSRGPGASAILPQIERLRESHHAARPAGARQTPAHRWLIDSARSALAQFPYFQRVKARAKDDVSHEAKHQTG
jgi:hypothetical protein